MLHYDKANSCSQISSALQLEAPLQAGSVCDAGSSSCMLNSSGFQYYMYSFLIDTFLFICFGTSDQKLYRN